MVQVGYEYYGHGGIVVKCAEFNHYSFQSETLYITGSIPGVAVLFYYNLK
jgi:hypothetical protein